MSRAKQLERVLIIDDDLDILTVAKYALQINKSLLVKCLSSSEDALRAISEFQPDVILLDLMMPKVDGLTVLKTLRSTKEMEAIPVIFFTVKALSDEFEDYIAMGAQGIIAKPFNPITLIEEVEEIWKKTNHF